MHFPVPAEHGRKEMSELDQCHVPESSLNLHAWVSNAMRFEGLA